MSPFVETVIKFSNLSAATINDLEEIVSVEQHSAGHQLLRIGKVSRHMYFIEKGLARVYYHFRDIDVTDYFAIDNQFIGGVESLFTGAPSAKGIELIEDSTVDSVDYKMMEALCSKHHDLERACRKLAVFGMLEGQQRIESIRFHEAKERYLALDVKYPGLLNRCPLKYIASYLGITQVSLSRLRASV